MAKSNKTKEKSKSNIVNNKNKVNIIDTVEKNPEVELVNNIKESVAQGITPEVQEEVVKEPSEINMDLPFDDKTVFILNRGAIFMEGDFMNPHRDTKIKRIDETNFTMAGVNEKGQPFGQPIKADKEWCDMLYAELVDYQTNPSKYTIEMAPLPSESTQNSNVQPAVQYANDTKPVDNTLSNVNPIITPESIHPETSIENKKSEIKIDGLIITKENVNEILRGANFTNKVNAPSPNVKNMAEAFNLDEIMNNTATEQMVEYGKSISNHISESFQARLQGGLPINEAQKLLDVSSKEYTYELITDNIGTFLKLKKGKIEIRVPSDSNDYLKVK